MVSCMLHAEVACWGCMLRLHAEVACWGCMLRLQLCWGACWGCMLRLHAEVACWGCMLRLHAEVACWGCMLWLHAEVACWGCMLKCMLRLHAEVACWSACWYPGPVHPGSVQPGPVHPLAWILRSLTNPPWTSLPQRVCSDAVLDTNCATIGYFKHANDYICEYYIMHFVTCNINLIICLQMKLWSCGASYWSDFE